MRWFIHKFPPYFIFLASMTLFYTMNKSIILIAIFLSFCNGALINYSRVPEDLDLDLQSVLELRSMYNSGLQSRSGLTVDDLNRIIEVMNGEPRVPRSWPSRATRFATRDHRLRI